MWLMTAKGLLVTSQITEGQLHWFPESISLPPGTPWLTLFHPEKGCLSLLCISYLQVSQSPIVARHSPHPHGDSTALVCSLSEASHKCN